MTYIVLKSSLNSNQPSIWLVDWLILVSCIWFRNCCAAVEYRAVWAQPESFDEILVGAGMISDHLPDTVQKALDSAARRSDVLSSQLPVSQTTDYMV